MTNHAKCNAFEQSSGCISFTPNYPILSVSNDIYFPLREFRDAKAIILLSVYKRYFYPSDVEVSNEVRHRQVSIVLPTKVSAV
jgi:hypothetical protein